MTQETHDALLDAAQAFGLELPDTSAPGEGYVQANGLRMHYLDWGGTGTPVLFLHGGNQTAHTWDLVCLQLRGDFHCLALDQRGHGETEAPKDSDGSPQAQREDVREAIEALGLERLALVGMSMGGLNTIAYSGRYPDRLLAVAIVDVGPTLQRKGFDEVGNFIRGRREFDSIDDALEYAHKFNPLRPKAHLRYSLLHALKQRDDGRWTWKYGQGQPQGEVSKEERERQAQKALQANEKLWEEVPRIPCPTLVFHGKESTVFHREDAEKLAATLPNGRCVTIEGAGHTVQGDQPRAFADTLRGFLREVL
ncbi:MAG: alpha/beta hydrolase [Chloroflexi bacterium]|nr:alpha/beta hydrolase [Chloroflexota bacterium]